MKEFTRILKFTLCSVSAAVIEMAVFALLNEFTGLPYWPCYLVALVLSVLWNFTLNRKFTFQSAANVPVAMAKVAAYYAVFTPSEIQNDPEVIKAYLGERYQVKK